MYNVKENVVHHMKKRGWSIATTSERSTIPVATLKNIVYGKNTDQRLTTLEKLANVFECSISDLIGETENIKEKRKVDQDLFRECLDSVESFLKNNNIRINKEKLTQVVDKIYSLVEKKKTKGLKYVIDDDTIEWILDNSK
jgi:transcriptional regulator with XRE-family HTH domain